MPPSAQVAALPLPAASRLAANKWVVAVAVSFGTLMGAIDSSIVNVALPQLRGAVGASIQEITWIVTGFAMATVVVMPLTAFLGRFFGQKRVYVAQAALAHARAKAAAAARDLATLQLDYTEVRAPQDGVVSKLSAREGQLVAADQPVAELVPDRTYVVANFKETQVGRMRPGEKATVEIDAYPGLKLPGRVESLSGGTGARFSLIPPDNASGNFVKVVERVPVRIAWAAPPLPQVALRAGLSAYVTVETR